MFSSKTRQFSYLLNQGWQNFRIGGMSNIIAIMSIACSLFLVCLYSLTSANLIPVFDFSKNIQVILYLKDGLSSEQISNLQQRLSHQDEILRIHYTTKEKALEKFRQTLGKDAVLLDGLKANPLPSSLELSLTDKLKEPALLNSFCRQLAKMHEVESIQGGVEWAQKLSSLQAAVKLILFSLGAVLIIISLFITTGTIHLTIDQKKDEIMVMRLVGATEWFIRFPFLVKGVMEGFLGGGLAIILSMAMYHVFGLKITPFLRLAMGINNINFLSKNEILLILLSGSLVGGLGAIISFILRSYHKRK